MRYLQNLGCVVLAIAGAQACTSCEHPEQDIVHTRLVRRMQPESQNASSSPRAPLEWGQLNVLHTTDTHGWLEGHLKEKNYGADWGDFVSFTKNMRNTADRLGVDLLLVDTGDLHDGAGLSDATDPNGVVALPIFEQVNYDLLTIGNHELYVSSIAYEHFTQFANYYGDRYVNSNVKIYNNATAKYETVGKQYRYFTTRRGLRIMAFGVLYDFGGNSNASQITKGADMVKESWFLQAVNFTQPIDLFVVIGHNPVRGSVSTLTTVYNAIRTIRPDTPIQMFGGHLHIRDFTVYDNKATGLASGRYCETLGWLAVNNIPAPLYNGTRSPAGVPIASKLATPLNTTSVSSKTPSNMTYARRYLDWNRATFTYHSPSNLSFDYFDGPRISQNITATRKALNLTSVYGCAPQTYCQYCKPQNDSGSIYPLLQKALAATISNATRASIPRLILLNSGSIRFDLVQGPFTYDDSFIVSPFLNSFQYIKDVPYSIASQVLGILNAGAYLKRSLAPRSMTLNQLYGSDLCVDPPILSSLERRSKPAPRIVRRQSVVTPGYVTKDDFGSDGDDTVHSSIPNYSVTNAIQANASFPTNGSTPATVDLIFIDFIRPNVLTALAQAGRNYSLSAVDYYMPINFTTQTYLPEYAKKVWATNGTSCPVGQGVGF